MSRTTTTIEELGPATSSRNGEHETAEDPDAGERKQSKEAGSEKQPWPKVEGATAALLRSELGQVRCVVDEWFVEKDGVWLPRIRDEFRPSALGLLPDQFRTNRNAQEVLKRLESEQQTTRVGFCGAAKLNGDGFPLICVQNGTLCIAPTGVLSLPTNPDDGFTIALPVMYDPGAKAPLFNRILREAISDDTDREMFLDLLATALIPDCRYEAALVAIGEAGTSKSTAIAPIPAMFGTACSSLSMADMCHPLGYKLAALRDRMINLATELNTLELEDSGLFKQLVSGETFTARPIYGRPFEMRSTATFVFLANSLPRFKSGTAAEIRRLRFVRFDRKVTVPDLTLKERVAAEAPGVFADLVRRASELIKGRPLANPSRWGAETAERFSISNDPVGQFVARCCTLGPKLSCPKAHLYSDFEAFREQFGISNKLDEGWFFRNLYERFPDVKQTKLRTNDGRVPAINGIDLKDDDDG